MLKLLIAAAALVTAAAPAAAQDAEKGGRVFARCASCHSGKAAAIGPSLAGIVGRKAASVAGFRYSKALTASGKTWTEAELNAYLAAPTKAVPGTTMFIGLPNATERADVIAYLKATPKP